MISLLFHKDNEIVYRFNRRELHFLLEYDSEYACCSIYLDSSIIDDDYTYYPKPIYNYWMLYPLPLSDIMDLSPKFNIFIPRCDYDSIFYDQDLKQYYCVLEYEGQTFKVFPDRIEPYLFSDRERDNSFVFHFDIDHIYQLYLSHIKT